MNNTFTWEFDREEGYIQVEVEFEISEYFPATYGQPEEGGEIEILSIWNLDTGEEVEVSYKELQALYQWVKDNYEPD